MKGTLNLTRMFGLILSGFILLASPAAHAQAYPPTMQQPAGTPALPSIEGSVIAGPSPRVAASQAEKRNEDRQRRLVDDTEKLYALATELKADVQKTNKDILSVDVVKKAEEIEKLAKSVKERMRGQA